MALTLVLESWWFKSYVLGAKCTVGHSAKQRQTDRQTDRQKIQKASYRVFVVTISNTDRFSKYFYGN